MPNLDFMKDETLQSIRNNLTECNLYLKSMSEGRTFSVDDIQTVSDISKAGLAKKYFQEGDQLIFDYTATNGTIYSMPFDMYLGRSATLADGTTREGIFLQSHYATLESIPFDAPEQEIATEAAAAEGLYYYGYDGSAYTLLSLSVGDVIPYSDYTAVYHNEVKDQSANICKYGYNRDTHCALTQWLNSAAGQGLWWGAKHIGDCAPAQHSSYRGFLAGLPADFVGAIEEIQISRAPNAVCEPDRNISSESFYAKFFLPSIEQLYVNPQAQGVEGDYWDYYKVLAEAAGLPGKFATGVSYESLISYALENHSLAQHVWLGSAYRGNSYNTWYVYTSGSVGSSSTHNANRCRPACFI